MYPWKLVYVDLITCPLCQFLCQRRNQYAVQRRNKIRAESVVIIDIDAAHGLCLIDSHGVGRLKFEGDDIARNVWRQGLDQNFRRIQIKNQNKIWIRCNGFPIAREIKRLPCDAPNSLFWDRNRHGIAHFWIGSFRKNSPVALSSIPPNNERVDPAAALTIVNFIAQKKNRRRLASAIPRFQTEFRLRNDPIDKSTVYSGKCLVAAGVHSSESKLIQAVLGSTKAKRAKMSSQRETRVDKRLARILSIGEIDAL